MSMLSLSGSSQTLDRLSFICKLNSSFDQDTWIHGMHSTSLPPTSGGHNITPVLGILQVQYDRMMALGFMLHPILHEMGEYVVEDHPMSSDYQERLS